MENTNISKIVASKLCNTCGGCFFICPNKAISFEETRGGFLFPVVNESLCNNCGLCLEICPGIGIRTSLLNEFGADPFQGREIASYVGKASDRRIFDNSQSGGIVSAILIHGLEKNLISGAVTVVMQEGMPPRPISKIAKNWNEIFQTQKSKYCPVPLLSVLSDLDKWKGPIAIVGLPCQIHGLLNILERWPKIKNKIAVKIGLFCDRTMVYSAMDYLIKKSFFKENVITKLHFRDKSISGYPGDVHLYFDNGRSTILPAKIRMRIKDYFTPPRCRICFDKMNVLSDITVGDPHGLDDVDRQSGESVLIVRTKIGHNIIKSAKLNNAIDIRTVLYKDILNGQRIENKKEDWRGYIEAWKTEGYKLPNYYDIVKEYASIPLVKEKYKKSILYSMNLDNYESRECLIKNVDKYLKLQSLKKRTSSLIRFFVKKLK